MEHSAWRAHRQVALDFETTGLDALEHRVIEIGAVELIGRDITGNRFHCLLNPEREVDEGAARVHGYQWADLQAERKFAEVADELWAFLQDSELLIHNAEFDSGFLNAEMRLLARQRGGEYQPVAERCRVTDTLAMARRLHPNQRCSLDALIERYGVRGPDRTLHNAQADAELLAKVYLAMTGGQVKMFGEPGQNLESAARVRANGGFAAQSQLAENRSATPVIRISDEEIAAHEQTMRQIAAEADKARRDG